MGAGSVPFVPILKDGLGETLSLRTVMAEPTLQRGVTAIPLA